jgi:malate synthase
LFGQVQRQSSIAGQAPSRELIFKLFTNMPQDTQRTLSGGLLDAAVHFVYLYSAVYNGTHCKTRIAMTDRMTVQGMEVDALLMDFIQNSALPGTGVDLMTFWEGMARTISELMPKNRALLARRELLQSQIDTWHIEHRDTRFDAATYHAFLGAIDYLTPEGPDFTIGTKGTDPEIADVPGPQLVVPVTNARYALNAANARWGSLYDALYGTDALGDLPQGRDFDPVRGNRVIDWAKAFLDDVAPLAKGSHRTVSAYAVANGALTPALRDPAQFVGYRGRAIAPDAIFLRNNGLHLMLCIDRNSPIAKHDPGGMCDIRMEAAVSVIMDCEDSVAAVDARDKVLAYRNWLGLMRGDLDERVEKNGQVTKRRLSPDLIVSAPDGSDLVLKGRALMLVRNVGHLMTNPAILDENGREVGEGIMDAFVTTLCAMHDLQKQAGPRNSGMGSTGFLDSTGDEIHTSMEAGPMVRKGDMKSSVWISAYEDRNVDIGLACGLAGRAQIGKGMWAAPDLMGDMLRDKISHPMAGANCAWVPSPTAATLHATHYHRIDVKAVQAKIAAGGARATLDALLTIPLAHVQNWSDAEIAEDVENNAQGLLGYVVRWVDQGIGCSKVPDIHDVGLMEDRATCRISAQALANWLHHGVMSETSLMATMRKMAAVVDGQNASDPAYHPMAPTFNGVAFRAACDLVFKGREQPSGYTEPVLHARRLEKKAGPK